MLRSDDHAEHGANGVPDAEPASDHALPTVCARVRVQLPALHDGTLDAAATRTALDHVAGCSNCAARFEQALADVYRLLYEARSALRDPGLRRALYARIAADRSERTEQPAGHAEETTAPVTSWEDAMMDMAADDTLDEDHEEHDAATAERDRSTPAPAIMPPPTGRPDRGRRLSRWLTSVAAVLVVALMAATLLTHYRGQRPLASATATVTAPTVSPTGTSGGAQLGPCTPKQIKVNLPARATIFDLTMTSPTEGWLVGAVFNTDYRTVQAGMIMHLNHCQWQPISDPLPNAFLDGISMVSPTEGWVTGFTKSGDNYLLHYAHGHWQQVTAPYQATDGSYFGGINMLSPDEGWLVINSKCCQPPIWSLLLHYQHGTWSQVTVPIPLVWDFAPVSPGELWIVGNSSTQNRQDSTLAHYRAGQWTTTPAPGHVLLDSLRLLSPTDGYAIGWQPQAPNSNPVPPQPAAVLRFDGTTWKPIQTGANVAAQTVVLFDHTDGWAFFQQPSADNPPIVSAQHEVGGHWQNVP